MRFGWPHISKPARGARIDWTHPLARGLQGFYALNEAAGLVAYDLTGNRNNGALNGALSWAPSVGGLCLSGFAGGAATTTTYVDCGNSPSLNPTAAITLAAYVYPTSIPSTPAFAVARDNSATGRSYAFGTKANNCVYLEINGTSVLTGNPGLPLNQWSVISASGSAATNIAGYLNGSNVATGSWQTPGISTTSTTIGMRLYSGDNNGFVGNIGWVGIWSRVLSPAEHALIGSPGRIWHLIDPGPLRSTVFFQRATSPGIWPSAPVQAKGAQSSGAVASLSVTLPSPVTAGDLILVYAPVYGAVSSVTDNQGNTYTLDSQTSGGSAQASIYRAAAKTSGTLTATVTGSGNIYANIYVEEWATASLGTVSVDGTPTQASGTSTTPAPGAITLAGGDLVASCVALNGSPGTVSPGAGFTLGYDGGYTAGTTEGGASEYQANAGAGSVSPGFALTKSAPWEACAVAYKLPAAASKLFRRTNYFRAGSRGVA